MTKRRKSAAEEGRILEEIAAVLDTALDAVVRMDAQGTITGWNARAAATFGWTAAEAIGQPMVELIVPPEHRDEHRHGMARFLATGERNILGQRIEISALHKDGRRIAVELAVNAVRVEDSWLFSAFLRDISLRKQADEDLRLQRALYRIAQAVNTVQGLDDLLRHVHEIVGELLPAKNFYIALYDEASNMLTFPYWASEHEPPPAPRAPGRGVTELVLRRGEPLLLTPELRRELHARGETVLIGEPTNSWLGVPLRVQDRIIGAACVQTFTEGTRFGEREKDILQFVSTQIAMAIDRKRSEAQLRDSESRYRLLFESNPEAMWVYDDETLRILAVNDAAIRRYGWPREQFLRMTIRDLRPPSEYARLNQIVNSRPIGPVVYTDLKHHRRDGTLIDVEILSDMMVFDGRRARLVLARDVTERKQLEAQFRQAQKMEAVGNLAGGVAHDFNNLLTAITGFSDLLFDGLDPGDDRRDDVAQIRAAARRAADLTHQLLAFSRKQMLQPRVLDLNGVVASIQQLLERLIGENISLNIQLAPDLAPIRADPVQLEQVIINLAVNARDAMPEGGQLTIETANAELDMAYTAEHSMVSPGNYVMLSVSDNGVGMDEAVRSRLFEPFFTTKGPGKGSGLGLSTVYGIVKQSGGYIWTYSEVGKGSSFKIYLPRVDAAVEALPEVPAQVAAAGGSETILLVEDEKALRAVARRTLERRGYTVIEAADGAAALALAAKAPDIALVLTDVVMPGMTGPEMAARLTSSRPELRVLFMSGYTDETIVRHGVLEPHVAFLQKPFSPETLARRVREVLEGAVPAAPRSDRR